MDFKFRADQGFVDTENTLGTSEVDRYLQMGAHQSPQTDLYPVEQLPNDEVSVGNPWKSENKLKTESEYIEFNDDLYNKLKSQLMQMRDDCSEERE